MAESNVRAVRAQRILTAGPGDVRELRQLLDSGALRAEEVLCVVGKTEGNGGRNDYSRDLAMRALEELFAPRLGVRPDEVQDRIIFSMSGGTEGVVTPHMVVFSQAGELRPDPAAEARLVIGTGYTRELHPEEIGRMAQVEETARAVRAVAAELRLDSPADVHLVQMKGAIPRYSLAQEEAARRAGRPLRCDMVYSRGASALGAALALGEVEAAALSDDVVCADYRYYSGVASVSAKPGLGRTEIMVFGNSRHAGGDLVIGHGVMQDLLDVGSARRVLAALGLPVGEQLTAAQRQRLVAVFAKSEADARGHIRGQRHTMLSDDDISDTRYSRCVLSSVLASLTGDSAVYVSTRAEHHGPQGGGPVAVIARAASAA